MIIATEKDRETVIDILSAAFNENQSVHYIVRQGRQRERSIRALMAYAFDVCRLSGEVWLSDNRQACLLYIYPERRKMTISSVWLDLRLVVQSVGFRGIKRALNREKQIKGRQPGGKRLYLWFIGVRPDNQQQGAGTRLLQQLIDVAAIESRIILLETSTERNLPWYRSLGFESYDELDLTYHLYFLKKDPD
jgi:ribosomal protein S18 acetylase RimI-like enzyme